MHVRQNLGHRRVVRSVPPFLSAPDPGRELEVGEFSLATAATRVIDERSYDAQHSDDEARNDVWPKENHKDCRERQGDQMLFRHLALPVRIYTRKDRKHAALTSHDFGGEANHPRLCVLREVVSGFTRVSASRVIFDSGMHSAVFSCKNFLTKSTIT
jgi:hypothetical protein